MWIPQSSSGLPNLSLPLRQAQWLDPTAAAVTLPVCLASSFRVSHWKVASKSTCSISDRSLVYIWLATFSKPSIESPTLRKTACSGLCFFMKASSSTCLAVIRSIRSVVLPREPTLPVWVSDHRTTIVHLFVFSSLGWYFLAFDQSKSRLSPPFFRRK